MRVRAAIAICRAALCATLYPIAAGRTAAAPRAVAFWNFSGPQPFSDVVNGYELLQHDPATPVPLVPTARRGGGGGGGFARAAAFGLNSSDSPCGSRCGSRLYAPRRSVPRLGAISGRDARATVVAWVQLAPGRMHGGFVGGMWQEDRSWRQYAIFMDFGGNCKVINGPSTPASLSSDSSQCS